MIRVWQANVQVAGEQVVVWTIGTSGGSSSSSLPIGGVVLSVDVLVTVAFSSGASLELVTDAPSPLSLSLVANIQRIGAYVAKQSTSVPNGGNGRVVATISGTPAQGAATLRVRYASILT